MGFTTIAFLAFLLAVAVVYRVCPARFRAALLAAVSYGYYCTWSPPAALLLLAATAVVFLAARAIGAARHGLVRQGTMLAALSGLLVLLAVFKLAPFLGSILNR